MYSECALFSGLRPLQYTVLGFTGLVYLGQAVHSEAACIVFLACDSGWAGLTTIPRYALASIAYYVLYGKDLVEQEGKTPSREMVSPSPGYLLLLEGGRCSDCPCRSLASMIIKKSSAEGKFDRHTFHDSELATKGKENRQENGEVITETHDKKQMQKGR